MTGFFAMVRGFNLRNEPTAAERRICGDHSVWECAIATPLQENRVPCRSNRCSSTGPRLNAGKNVSAPTITMTPVSRIVNSGVLTGNMPTDGGIRFFRARFPARARAGIIMRKRPESMVNPRLRFYQGVLALNPAKAEPLLPAADVNA